MVIDDTEIRWGTTTRPERQVRLDVHGLVSICYHLGDVDYTYAVTSQGKRFNFPERILGRNHNRESFLKAVGEKFPDVKVEQK